MTHKNHEDDLIGKPNEFLDEDDKDTADEHSVRVEAGDEETDVYTEEGREELVEDDEIDSWEGGFSRGEEHPKDYEE
ncbi:hypothetical protein COV18_02520 [Candidatus Woesearchaeota archaeon CG10_big_fil_rev_8_21_14_0_10_37_12]|nr:MAG: hypothetical protein COV18_02520 [Candidatus Woesearchaeota archaeon CG10_big_fil_rev_8_21_14_0_10_37_12]